MNARIVLLQNKFSQNATSKGVPTLSVSGSGSVSG